GAGAEGFPEGSATSACPRRIIDRQPRAECLPAVSGQQRPGNRQIAGRVTDAACPEVNDGRQLAVRKQKVSLGDVAMEPAVYTVPAGVECSRPDLANQLGIDVAVQLRER